MKKVFLKFLYYIVNIVNHRCLGLSAFLRP